MSGGGEAWAVAWRTCTCDHILVVCVFQWPLSCVWTLVIMMHILDLTVDKSQVLTVLYELGTTVYTC